jgi:hypothetical protein
MYTHTAFSGNILAATCAGYRQENCFYQHPCAYDDILSQLLLLRNFVIKSMISFIANCVNVIKMHGAKY